MARRTKSESLADEILKLRKEILELEGEKTKKLEKLIESQSHGLRATTGSAGGLTHPLRGDFVIPPKGGVWLFHWYLTAS